MAILVRIVSEAFLPILADWRQIIVFVSIASMALGSFAAIGQKNIKRLMAYSSIGHMGFALVGLAAAGVKGAIVISAGFRETGPEGAALEQEAREEDQPRHRDHPEAQRVEALDVMALQARRIQRVEVVGAEVGIDDTSAKHPVRCGEDSGGD